MEKQQENQIRIFVKKTLKQKKNKASDVFVYLKLEEKVLTRDDEHALNFLFSKEGYGYSHVIIDAVVSN